MNDLKSMHTRSQRSINPKIDKKNVPLNDITNQKSTTLEADQKSTWSISDFYGDQEFVEFLKNVSIYCTSEEEPDSITQYKRLYKNLEWLRGKFQTYKRNKSVIRTEYDYDQSDECNSVQPTFAHYEPNLDQINIEQFSTLQSNNTHRPDPVPKIAPVRTSSRLRSRMSCKYVSPKPVKATLRPKAASKSKVPKLKSVAKPSKSIAKMPKSSRSRQLSQKQNGPQTQTMPQRRSKQVNPEPWENFEVPPIEKEQSEVNDESLDLDGEWEYSSPNFKWYEHDAKRGSSQPGEVSNQPTPKRQLFQDQTDTLLANARRRVGETEYCDAEPPSNYKSEMASDINKDENEPLDYIEYAYSQILIHNNRFIN